MFFKKKKKSVNEYLAVIEESKPKKFDLVLPDEPSILKVSYLSIKDFFDKRDCKMNNFTFNQIMETSSYGRIQMFLNSEFLIDFAVNIHLPLDEHTARYVHSSIIEKLDDCDDTGFKLELLNL